MRGCGNEKKEHMHAFFASVPCRFSVPFVPAFCLVRATIMLVVSQARNTVLVLSHETRIAMRS